MLPRSDHDLINNEHVPGANDPVKDNIVMSIEKSTNSEENEFHEYPAISEGYNDG